MSLGDDVSVLTEGPLIWAIDDEDEVLAMLESLLVEAGYRFQGFLDPHRALEERPVPDLILLDLMIPTMSGFEFLRAMRAMPELQGIPVVVITAASSESVLVNAFESGADDVIYKPFNIIEMMTRVRWQIRRTQRTRDDARALAHAEILESLAVGLLEASGEDAILEALTARLVRPLGLSSCRVYTHRGGELHQLGAEHTLDLSPWPELAEAVAGRRSFALDASWAQTLGQPAGERGIMIPLVDNECAVGLMCTWWVGPPSETLAALLARVEPMLTSALGRDTSARVYAQATSDFDALADTRDFLANIIAASPDPVVAADEKGEIKVFNPAAVATLGWSRAEALGQNVRMLYAEGEAEEIMREMREAPRGLIEKRRWSLLDRNGRSIPVELSAVILYRNGHESGSVGLFRDLRDSIEIQERLARVTRHLEQSKQHAMIAEIAGATAHELNQPLTSLLGYAELLSGAPNLAAPYQKAVGVISQESERIAQIVRELSNVTQYRTKDYVGGTRIVDLGSSEE